MQIPTLLLAAVFLGLSSASVIPIHTRTHLQSAHARSTSDAVSNAALWPENFAQVQNDRRRALRE
ncbi:hypothetical protein GGS21DRAFT_502853 [Xylaria nigripes]|nr:hypothetical protein GGS21DRAFT_502853 [Xylaria nigripes]